jgi:hypothetical protein
LTYVKNLLTSVAESVKVFIVDGIGRPILGDLASAVDAHVSADPVLKSLAAGNIRTGGKRCVPSAIDLAAAVIARRVIERPAVAFALPRGRTRTSFLIALDLSLARLRGSVALATLDLEVRNLARYLQDVGAAITEAVEVHRLGIGGTYVELRTGRRGKLDGGQHLLLLHSPHLRPQIERGVVSVSVLDAYSMRPDGWEAVFAWNAADQRGQVWVGELGNAAFERFCNEKAIPLVRFDWPTIEALVRDDYTRCGTGPLSSYGLCQRAWYPPRFVLRPVADGEVNELIAELEQHFASYHRKASKLRVKGLEEPDVVRSARRLFYFLARSVVPLSVYEPLALDVPRSFRPAKALKRVREARGSEFHGNWKKLLTEWSAVRYGLSALYDRVKAEHPKFWDLYFLLEEERAREPHRHVVLRCATKMEARALEFALVDQGAVDASDFTGFLEVRWFGVRSGPLEYGPRWSNILTVLFEPPSPNHAGVYLTAEKGSVEALLYPVECQRFRRRAEETTEHSAASVRNIEALAALGWPVESLALTPPPSSPEVEQVEPFEIPGRREPKTLELGNSVHRMQDHWEEYLQLEHGDEPDSAEEDVCTHERKGDGEYEAAGRLVSARLVRFESCAYVYFRVDGTVDVLFAERPLPQAVKAVRPGQTIIFMEGSERGSVLTELFEHFDDQYGPAKIYGELWRRALLAALEKAGSETALAQMLKPSVTDETVRNWRSGLVLAPQDEGHVDQIIDLSGEQVAQHNHRGIRRYIERVRGAHRMLGRIFNRAVVEQLWEPGGPEQRKLEEMLGGVDLTELFSSVELRTVAWAATESRDVPPSLLGRTLRRDHPELRGHLE